MLYITHLWLEIPEGSGKAWIYGSSKYKGINGILITRDLCFLNLLASKRCEAHHKRQTSIREVISYSNRRKGVTCGLIYTDKCRYISPPWTVYATYIVHRGNILSAEPVSTSLWQETAPLRVDVILREGFLLPQTQEDSDETMSESASASWSPPGSARKHTT